MRHHRVSNYEQTIVTIHSCSSEDVESKGFKKFSHFIGLNSYKFTLFLSSIITLFLLKKISMPTFFFLNPPTTLLRLTFSQPRVSLVSHYFF